MKPPFIECLAKDLSCKNPGDQGFDCVISNEEKSNCLCEKNGDRARLRWKKPKTSVRVTVSEVGLLAGKLYFHFVCMQSVSLKKFDVYFFALQEEIS